MPSTGWWLQSSSLASLPQLVSAQTTHYTSEIIFKQVGDVIVWHLSAITQVSSEATNFNIHLSARITNIKFCRGFVHLGAGLSVGLSGLAAGYAIGIVGDAGVRGTAQQPRLYVGMILILIFAEVLGLYGLIVAIYMIFNH